MRTVKTLKPLKTVESVAQRHLREREAEQRQAECPESRVRGARAEGARHRLAAGAPDSQIVARLMHQGAE